MSEPYQMTVKIKMDTSNSSPTFDIFEIEAKEGKSSKTDEQPAAEPNFTCLECRTGYVVLPKIVHEYPVPQSNDFVTSATNSDHEPTPSGGNVETPDRFECTECHKSFSIQYTLTQHSVKEHDTKQRRVCKICKKESVCSKAELYSHIRRRHPTNVPREAVKAIKDVVEGHYPCAYCEESVEFVAVEELKKHLREIHDQKHVCDVCFKCYARPDNLKLHKREKHVEGEGEAKKMKLI